jgi:predicted MFS family arabinose efflux permease
VSHDKLAASARSVNASASDEAARAGNLHVWLLIGSGVVASAQIGKAIIIIPLIQSELSLGLDLAGLIVATFATLGAIIGIGAGVVVGRLSVRRSLIGGMSAMAVGTATGAGASHEVVLLGSRIIEGIGLWALSSATACCAGVLVGSPLKSAGH